jgi:hypothetical protein
MVFLSALSLRCESKAAPGSSFVDAKFGIFYGGQIQQRQKLPLEVDPAKQRHGFRLDFSQPPLGATPVYWEIDTPAPTAPGKAGGPKRLTRVGWEQVRAGQDRLDHAFSFEPKDRVGLWNFRVLVGEAPVIDQAVLVYDPNRKADEPLKLEEL